MSLQARTEKQPDLLWRGNRVFGFDTIKPDLIQKIIILFGSVSGRLFGDSTFLHRLYQSESSSSFVLLKRVRKSAREVEVYLCATALFILINRV